MPLKWVKKKKKKQKKEIPKVEDKPKEVKPDAVSNKIPVIKDKLKDNVFYYESTKYEPLKDRPPWLHRKSYKEYQEQVKFIEKNKDKVILIKMEMSNGQFREFLVADDCGSFIYKKGRYVLDPPMKYYIIDRDLWAYDFHEFLSIPLRKKYTLTHEIESLLEPAISTAKKRPLNPRIDVNEVKMLIENAKVVDVENSINPLTLKRFTDSEVIKQVLQGAMLSKLFKIMFVLIIIVSIVMFLLLIVNLYSSGIFEKLAGYFK